MAEEKESRLAELEERLADLKKRDPAHCYGTKGFVPHSMTPRLYQEIEDLEDEIKRLKIGERTSEK